jgi:type I restriction enzyme R subunit
MPIFKRWWHSSGEVEFADHDADSSHLVGQKFTESNMNPNLKGREMRKAFDSDDFQVMMWPINFKQV